MIAEEVEGVPCLNRLIGKKYPDGSIESFQYDPKGNVTYAGNKNIAYNLIYDPMGRLTGVTDSNGRSLTYRYNALGQRTGMTAPDGSVVEYAYDVANRLANITEGTRTFTFSYDPTGRRTSLSYPNGAVAEYAYDAAGRLTSLTHKTSTGATIAGFAYTLDNVGNRLTKTQPDTKDTYTYDNIYRLLKSLPTKLSGKDKDQENKSETYGYDRVGNRLTGPQTADAYSYDKDNELTNDSKHSYRYDNNGNLIEKTGTDDDGTTKTWTYAYDYDNRLVKVTKQEATETETVTFKYDPFGRRVEKRVEEQENGTTETKTYAYVYDNEDVILEYQTKSDGKVETTEYTHGPGIDEPLAIERKGDVYYYHADGLGSITALTDSNQKTVESYTYSAFGELKRKGDKVKNTYTYTGREWDEETGLYYYRARYYDARAGRFISKDSIGFAGGDVNLYGYVDSVGKPLTETNLYAYTGNSPVSRIDPLGLYWEYSQSTQQLTYVDNQTGARTPIGNGYSGNGAGLNNPNMQNVPYVGPIPQGTYDIGPQRDSRRTGPGVMDLTPRPGTNTFNRDSFQIHGDNSCRCQSASSGCIISDRNIRDQINNSSDRELRVVQ